MTFLPHTMLERALWVQACLYAQSLYPGAIVDPLIDGPYVAPFAGLLDDALRVHGLKMIGTVVERIEEREGAA